MKLSKIVFSLIAAGALSLGLFAADAAKAPTKSHPGKKAGCCVKAEKDGKACAHGCCVDAEKAGKNCEKCNGTNEAK